MLANHNRSGRIINWWISIKKKESYIEPCAAFIQWRTTTCTTVYPNLIKFVVFSSSRSFGSLLSQNSKLFPRFDNEKSSEDLIKRRTCWGERITFHSSSVLFTVVIVRWIEDPVLTGWPSFKEWEFKCVRSTRERRNRVVVLKNITNNTHVVLTSRYRWGGGYNVKVTIHSYSFKNWECYGFGGRSCEFVMRKLDLSCIESGGKS